MKPRINQTMWLMWRSKNLLKFYNIQIYYIFFKLIFFLYSSLRLTSKFVVWFCNIRSCLVFQDMDNLILADLNVLTNSIIRIIASGLLPNGLDNLECQLRYCWFFCILYTLPSEIVRTVLVIAIKNHCWLWTTIPWWKKK